MEKIERSIESFHRKYNLHKVLLLLLLLANLSYLSYLLIIGYFNTILVDDYCFMANYKQHGILGSISYWYQNWQGRFSPQLMTNLIVKMYETTQSTLPYTLFLIALFIYSINRLLHLSLPIQNNPNQYHHFLLFNLSLFIFNLFIVINFEFSTLFWINVSTMYFGGLAFALLGVGGLLSKSENIINYVFIIIGFGYAGSSAEHFGAICSMVLLAYLTYLIYIQKIGLKNIFSVSASRKAFIAVIICVIVFIIMVKAPGNEIRRSYFPKISIVEACLIALKSLFDLFTKLLTEKVKYFIVLSFPFIYLGTLLRKKENLQEFKVAITILLSLPVLISFIYICLVPSAYAISGIGPLRGLTHIAFYLTVYIAFISFIIGFQTSFPKKIAFLFTVLSCVFLLLIARDRIRLNLPDTIQYTRSEKNRMDSLLNLKVQGTTKPVELEKLSSGPNNVLWYDEIGKDSSDVNQYWINQCISDGLELGFEIKLKK